MNIGSNIPRVSPLALVEVQFSVLSTIEKLASQLPPRGVMLSDGGGRAARRLAELDSISVEAWLQRRCWTAAARRLGALTVEMLLGVEPAQVSMLCLLQYVRDNESLSFLVEVDQAAQQWWVGNGGAGRAAARLIEVLSAEHGRDKSGGFEARLGCPVVSVTQQADSGVGPFLRIETAAGDAVDCDHVILAVPPISVRDRIQLNPAPPREWELCASRAFMGCYTKAVALYDHPFWRERGLSGTCMRIAFDADHPVQNVYDHSETDYEAAPDGNGSCGNGHGTDGEGSEGSGKGDAVEGPRAALVCFLAGDAAILYAGASADELQAAVVRSLVRFFGEEARSRLLEVIAYEWAADPWARGCPVNLLGVGQHARHEAALREPLMGGRLLWASTEAAPAFTGYMEGAVRAGEAAAAAVLQGVKGGVKTAEPAPKRKWGWSGSGARDGGPLPRAPDPCTLR